MSERIGTCQYCYEVQELYEVPLHAQPHEMKPRRVVDRVEYLCDWIAKAHKPLPPPLGRLAGGGVVIDGDDCERCERYAAIHPEARR